MASSWIDKRSGAKGPSYRVRYRLGGRESSARYGGSFSTKAEARARQAFIDGEMAAMRVPNLRLIDSEPVKAPTFREAATRWQASRVDVREATLIQHQTALNRALPTLGDVHVDEITPALVADLVAQLDAKKKARESIRKRSPRSRWCSTTRA